MSQPAVSTFTPLYIKDVDLILGNEATGANYKCHLRGVKLTPDVGVQKVKTLCPAGTYSEVDTPEWSLEISYLDGTDTAMDGLWKFLRTNSGVKMPFLFRPKAGGEGVKGIVTIMPGGYGGNQGAFSEQSVTLPLDGQPEDVPAVTV